MFRADNGCGYVDLFVVEPSTLETVTLVQETNNKLHAKIVYALLSVFYIKLAHAVETNMRTRETCHSGQRLSVEWTQKSASFPGR